MYVLHRIVGVFALAVAFMVAGVAPCGAETVQGRIRGVARAAEVLSLEVAEGRNLLLNWNKGTAWKNVNQPADLREDDVLAVDYTATGDQAVATGITRLEPSVPVGMKTVTIEALAGKGAKVGGALPFTLIDVRPGDRFEAVHLPGAVSVPLRRMEKRSVGILPEDRTAAIVFYDEGAGDGSAVKAAELARKAGYADVAVFPEGAAGWGRSGRVLISSSSFLRRGKGIIIDLRSPERVAAGHIERATSIPAARLSASSSLFPKAKHVPIVVYGENDEEVVAAARTIRAWGYRQVTIYPGGVAAWLESAEVLTTEPASETISAAVPGTGSQIMAKDFELAIQSPISVQMVDVRSAADYAKGHLTKSVHIPLQQLTARYSELDREMIQVVFAADEMQAEMAAEFLKQKDYRVIYLQGRVEFKSDGSYQVK